MAQSLLPEAEDCDPAICLGFILKWSIHKRTPKMPGSLESVA